MQRFPMNGAAFLELPQPLVKREPPRILIVGGNGFIGRHLVAAACRRGWNVTKLSRSSSGDTADISSLAVNITDLPGLKRALAGRAFEYVVNCGGNIDHAAFDERGREILDAHFQGVINLTQVLDRTALAAFVNLGSSDEYGNSPAAQNERQREAPISPYSLGKVAATHFLQMLHRSQNYPAVTLRLFLSYGPGQDERRFLPQVIRGCLEDRAFPASEGRQLRDFCFVEDIAAAVFATLDCPAVAGEVINIGSGKPVSIRQVIGTVQELVGGGRPLFGKVAYRRGENMELYPDISKAGSLLQWRPQVALAEGMRQTIQSIREAK
jgi:nucleoside-diphosphate-sugar epimerase